MSNGVILGSVLLLEGLGVPGEYLANVHLRGRNHLTFRGTCFYGEKEILIHTIQ